MRGYSEAGQTGDRTVEGVQDAQPGGKGCGLHHGVGSAPQGPAASEKMDFLRWIGRVGSAGQSVCILVGDGV